MQIKIETAGKKQEAINEKPANVVLIAREGFSKYGYKSYMELFWNVPGFYMIDSDFCLEEVNFGVRGFFSDGPFNELFYFIKRNESIGDTSGDYQASNINAPVEDIDRIENNILDNAVFN